MLFSEVRPGWTIRQRWVPWAQLLLEVFSVDVLVCLRCASQMQCISVIQQPKATTAILDCLSQRKQPL